MQTRRPTNLITESEAAFCLSVIGNFTSHVKFFKSPFLARETSLRSMLCFVLYVLHQALVARATEIQQFLDDVDDDDDEDEDDDDYDDDDDDDGGADEDEN